MPEYKAPERIREARKSLDMSQADFGKKLGGLSNQNISNIETNTTELTAELLFTICKAYQLDANYILGLDNREHVDITDFPPKTRKAIKLIADTLKTELK